MAYTTKNLKREAGNLPIPQYFNTVADDFEPLQGVNGAGRVLLYDAAGNALLTSGNPGYVTADTELPAATLLASASAVPTTPKVGSVLMAQNAGATLDLLQVDAVKNLKVGLRSSTGTEPAIGGQFDGESASSAGLVSWSRNILFNETTWDRMRGNTQGTLLASAARTATTASANQTNYNAKGVIVFINVTAISGTGGLTLQLYAPEPISGGWNQLGGNPTIITAIGVYCFALYPGATTAAGSIRLSVSAPLPRTWFANVAVGDSSSYTYSVGYSLIL